MFEWAHGDGWGRERKEAHERAERIEHLLKEEVHLLRQILAQLKHAQQTYNAPGPVTMKRV
jgi:hypothetical protein